MFGCSEFASNIHFQESKWLQLFRTFKSNLFICIPIQQNIFYERLSKDFFRPSFADDSYHKCYAYIK